MSFLSFHFALFFVVVVLLIRGLLDSHASRKNCLILASYYFYATWDPRFALLLATMTVANYYCGKWINRASTIALQRLFLSIAVFVSVGILFYFKYADFFLANRNHMLQSAGLSRDIPLLNIAVPVGISFYTFQSITYPLDIYRGKIRPISDIRDFTLFLSFFPQLVAGPIVRASHFLPQLQAPRPPYETTHDVEIGLALMLRGYIKKIILADVLATELVDPAFAAPAHYSSVFLLLGLYGYSFQVYLDFSGYTDIARGAARMLGYDLPINFNRPYLATSISDFWQRWHISMSSFFRDYLYFSLGGSRHGNVYLNIILTFLAIGIWHGAGWNFVLYGLFHGAMVAIERWSRKTRERVGRPVGEHRDWRWILAILWTFNLVALARILFRGGSIEGAGDFARALITSSGDALPPSWLGFTALACAIVLHFTPPSWADAWIRGYVRCPAWLQAGVIVGLLLAFNVFSPQQAPFVYFQF